MLFALIIFSFPSSGSDSYIPWKDFQISIEKLVSDGNIEDAVKSIKQRIKSTPSERNKKQTWELLSEVLNIFQLEETQKKFYHADSLKIESPEKSLEILKELRKLEPFSEKILLELAWTYIYTNSCDSAKEPIDIALERNPQSYKAKLLKLSMDKCTGVLDKTVLENFFQEVTLEPIDEIPVKLLLLNFDAVAGVTSSKDRRFIDSLKTKYSDYPPLIYLLTLGEGLKSKETREWKEKYLSICQNHKAKVVRKYENFPLICADLPLVLSGKKTS